MGSIRRSRARTAERLSAASFGRTERLNTPNCHWKKAAGARAGSAASVGRTSARTRVQTLGAWPPVAPRIAGAAALSHRSPTRRASGGFWTAARAAARTARVRQPEAVRQSATATRAKERISGWGHRRNARAGEKSSSPARTSRRDGLQGSSAVDTSARAKRTAFVRGSARRGSSPRAGEQVPGREPGQRVAPEVVAVQTPVATPVVVREDAALVERLFPVPQQPAERREVPRLQLRRAVPVERLQRQQVLAGVAVELGRQDERRRDQEEAGHRRQQDVTGQRSHRTYDSALPRRH